jgi:hypothetical protein
MSASRAFGDALDARGIWWPRGDGDALRELALAWKVTAEVVEDLEAVLDQCARATMENYHGAASDRFAGHWNKWSGDRGYLSSTVADIRRLVAALTDFGTDIDVADRTLARLVEQAVDETQRTPTPANTEVWMAWLHDCSAAIRSNLDAAATRCGDGLSPIVEAQPPRVTEVQLAAIHASEITWPDMGIPSDLSAIATGSVDFGAGQGRLPVELDPSTPVPPTIPAIPSPVAPPPTTIVVVGDGNTVTVTPPPSPPPTPFVPVPPLSPLPSLPPLVATPLPTLPGVSTPPVIPPADAVPPAVTKPPFGRVPEKGVDVPLPTDRRVPDDAPGLGSGGAGGGGFSGGGSLPSFEPYVPTIDPISPLPPLDTTALPTPVPASSLPAASAAVAATGVAATAAAAGKSASNKGFFPMMPMAGGGSGDESPEPKRRSARRPRPPGS